MMFPIFLAVLQEQQVALNKLENEKPKKFLKLEKK